MEQSVRSDSTRMPSCQREASPQDAEARREAAVTTMLTAPATATRPFSAAAEVSLAHMVVDYFGDGAINPILNCDIALRDRARAILAEAAEPDPIFAAIAESRALQAARDALYCGHLPDAAPEWGPYLEAYEAWGEHLDGVLTQTVPTTAAGCVALARFAVEFHAEEGVSITAGTGCHDENLQVLRLIAQSPALVSERPAPINCDEAEAAALVDAIEQAWTAFWEAETREQGDTSFEAEERIEPYSDRCHLLVREAEALPAISRAARHAKALAHALRDAVELVHGKPRADYDLDLRLVFDINASLAAGSDEVSLAPEAYQRGGETRPLPKAEDLVRCFDFQAMPVGELRTLFDHADTLAHVSYGLLAMPCSEVDRKTGQPNPAGELPLWIADACTAICDQSAAEARRRGPEGKHEDDRLTVLAEQVVQNGDADEMRACARDLLALADRV